MRKLRFLSAFVMIFLIISLLAAGCSANNGDRSQPEFVAPGDYSESGKWDNNSLPGRTGEDALKDKVIPGVSPPGAVVRKFIENGQMELRSADVEKTFKALSDLAASLDGRVVSYNQQVGDTYKTITMLVTVPFGKLTSFMEHAGESATKIESQSVKSDEVTEEYYDTKVRIESTENLIEHYRELLKKAETIEDTLRVQTRIDELTVELESLKGRFQLLEYLTQESRIDITIRMEKDPTITKPEVTWKTLKWSDVGYLMKNAVQKVGIGIALGFQYFLVFLAYAAPFIVLIILIIILVWLIRRRKRRKIAKKAEEAVAAQPQLPPEQAAVMSPEGDVQPQNIEVEKAE